MYNLLSDLWSATDDMQGSLMRAVELERENKKLRAENKELRKKLAEAQRTIAAAALEPIRTFNHNSSNQSQNNPSHHPTQSSHPLATPTPPQQLHSTNNQDTSSPNLVLDGSLASAIIENSGSTNFSPAYAGPYEAEVKIEVSEEKERDLIEVPDEGFYETILCTLAGDGLQCPLCPQRFTKRSSTVRHLIRQHGLDEERVKIRTYKRSFSFSKLSP